MKKILLAIFLSFYTVSLFAQGYSVITGQVKNTHTKEVKLYKTANGRMVECATTQLGANGEYGFALVPERPGFYCIGEPFFNFIVYLKGGEEVHLDILETRAELSGKNTLENKALYRWEDYIAEVRLKSMFFMYCNSTYEDFFPAFNKLVEGMPAIRSQLKSGNKEFDSKLQQLASYELDHLALFFLCTPRSKHPTKEMRPDFYRHIASPKKFADETVLDFPNGVRMASMYVDFVAGHRLQDETPEHYMGKCLELLGADRLKGEYLLENEFLRYKSYDRYESGMERYGRYMVNPSMLERAESIGAQLYETKTGCKAADFTYADMQGKKVSLSDFKGKVVLVDVWATWCGPCRKELPYLKKLAENLNGTDVVIMGVSLDEEKNKAKWEKAVKDEGLPGVQLFAAGWTKITKDYKIQGIPRFMVFDREGNIVSTDAPRPSNPQLLQLLKRELQKK